MNDYLPPSKLEKKTRCLYNLSYVHIEVTINIVHDENNTREKYNIKVIKKKNVNVFSLLIRVHFR